MCTDDLLIGILGGCGPWATIDIEAEILDEWKSCVPIKREQDFLPLLVYNYPKFGDRNTQIYEKKNDLYYEYLNAISRMKSVGANLFILACNTAHFYLEQIKREFDVPFISIIDSVISYFKEKFPSISRVGLLATKATSELGIYSDVFMLEDIDIVIPSIEGIKNVMKVIYEIKISCNRCDIVNKKDLANHSRKSLVESLRYPVQEILNKGCQHIILGCTELPLILPWLQEGFPEVVFVNPNRIIASNLVSFVQTRFKGE